MEEIIEQCADSGECTWQRRNGHVEVSTKSRLSSPAARETRLYHIRDLMLEAPYFAAGDSGSGRSDVSKRKTPDELAAELFSAIIDTIEPEAWDPPPVEETGDEVAVPRNVNANRPTTPPHPQNNRSGGFDPNNAESWVDYVKKGGTLDIRDKWATMRVFNDQLIVIAPDLIHRQIIGYPAAIRPTDLDDPQEPHNPPAATSPIGAPASPAQSRPEPAAPAPQPN